MSAESEQWEIYEWHRRLQLEKGLRTNLAADIEHKIGNQTSAARLRALNFLLASEYRGADRFADEERTYHLLHEQYPNDPLPLVFLAGSKLYCQEQAEAALLLIEEAIPIADRSGNFRRLALGVKARIALELRAYSEIEGILRALLALKFEPSNLDCGIERDFFDRLPADVIDKGRAQEYDRHARRARPRT
jgi:hypothetical protein